MPNIRPFRGVSPSPKYAEKVQISHGVGGDRENATAEITANQYSLLHVTNPELLLTEEEGSNEDLVRFRSREKLKEFFEHGILLKDETDCYYVYRLTLGDHKQTGLAAAADIQDYLAGKIKKHELTRVEKVLKQDMLMERFGGYIEPVILSYDSTGQKHILFEEWADSHPCFLDFRDRNNIRHQLWVISDEEVNQSISEYFAGVDSLYICDGHHRIAAGAKFYEDHQTEESRFVLALIFPSEETMILDYNRAVMDLNGLTEDEFLSALQEKGFSLETLGSEPARPTAEGEYTMLMDGIWYRLSYNGPRDYSDPVASLDVSILQDLVIRDILGISNPQADHRISFISGTKGLEGLVAATKKDMKVAFAITPCSMHSIMQVADAEMSMPPKSTCFEPKPVSGVVMMQTAQ